jgi:hypothetical protein
MRYCLKTDQSVEEKRERVFSVRAVEVAESSKI